LAGDFFPEKNLLGGNEKKFLKSKKKNLSQPPEGVPVLKLGRGFPQGAKKNPPG